MTIYALSTAPGQAGLAVVRISGSAAKQALETLCRASLPPPRLAALRVLRHPATSEVLDKGLVLWFQGPASFTGEDVVELHLHGGKAVLSGIFNALSSLGLKLAQPGEFTRRAFLNGKLDLTEAEGLADLINANTAAQRRQALVQMDGALRAQYEAWRTTLLRAMAFVEASIDFSDEGDIAETAFKQAIPEAKRLAAELSTALADKRRGEILREGIQVAIIGAPNVGKSSLLNALSGRDAAIVFDEPGTTRDIVEVALDLDGFSFVLRDTAGIRKTASSIELEGIRRAEAAAREADIVILVHDASAIPVSDALRAQLLTPAEMTSFPRQTIAVLNKIDLDPGKTGVEGAIALSAKTGAGLDLLRAALVAYAKETYGLAEATFITRVRHREELQRAHESLTQFILQAQTDGEAELAAEHLREAGDALARLTGKLDVEEILGQIFSEFCVGK